VTGRLSLRRAKDVAFRAACALAFLVAVAPLGVLLVHAVPRAWGAIATRLVVAPSAPLGDVAGLGQALVGSATIAAAAAAIGIPLGVVAGAFAAESPRGGRAARLAVDLLAGVPAVVIGLFTHVVMVLPMRRYSLLAGAVALSLIILPPVARGTDALLRLVPQALRDTAVSLGLPRWRVVVFGLLPAARRGIAATAALAVSRALGETAPLLLTTAHGNGLPTGLLGPAPALPVAIWLHAGSPHEVLQARAWAAALLLLVLALCLRVASLVLRRDATRAGR